MAAGQRIENGQADRDGRRVRPSVYPLISAAWGWGCSVISPDNRATAQPFNEVTPGGTPQKPLASLASLAQTRLSGRIAPGPNRS